MASDADQGEPKPGPGAMLDVRLRVWRTPFVEFAVLVRGVRVTTQFVPVDEWANWFGVRDGA